MKRIGTIMVGALCISATCGFAAEIEFAVETDRMNQVYAVGKKDTVKTTEGALKRLRIISGLGRERNKFFGRNKAVEGGTDAVIARIKKHV